MRPSFPLASDPSIALSAPSGHARSLAEARALHPKAGALAAGFAPEIFDDMEDALARHGEAVAAGCAEIVPVFEGVAGPGKPLARGGTRRWPNPRPERALRWRVVVRYWPIPALRAPAPGGPLPRRREAPAPKLRPQSPEGRLRPFKPQAPLDFGLFAGDYEVPARGDPDLLIPDE